MDSSINISLSPVQILSALAFQIWIIIFPIIIIKKLNYLTELLEHYLEGDQTTS